MVWRGAIFTCRAAAADLLVAPEGRDDLIGRSPAEAMAAPARATEPTRAIRAAEPTRSTSLVI